MTDAYLGTDHGAGIEVHANPGADSRLEADALESDARPSEHSTPRRRVLHVYAGNLYGGLEVFLATLARAQGRATNLEPEFALCFEGRLSRELRDAGAKVHLLGPTRFSRPWTVWRARRELAKVLADRQPDLVIGHECWPYILAAPVARRAGCTLAFWSHGNHVGNRWFERLAQRVEPALALFPSRYLWESDPLFAGLPRREIAYYPVDPPAIADRADVRNRLRRQLNASETDTVILMAARLTPYKGHELLLEALGQLRDHPGWVLWLAGGVQQPAEAVYLDQLRGLAVDGGIADRIVWLGQRSDVSELLAAADLFCHPNTGPEPFGIAFVEALHANLPVVTTRHGGGAEIVTESCGVLVSPGDSAALAGALAGLIDDPAQRARLGAAGPARALQLCDPEKSLTRIEQVLNAAIDRASVGVAVRGGGSQ
jgi:glycosyltransferase involved in cell wall biosynthesis